MYKISESTQKYYEALIVACEAHGGQMYDKNKPYLFHLTSVGMTLSRFGFSFESHLHLHLCAILHDTLEDTDLSRKEIKERFGHEVMVIVDLLTDDPKGCTNRHERHLQTYPKLATNRDAILVKLADRITNAEYSEYSSSISMWKKYRKEYKYFRDTLYFADHLDAQAMWARLDDIFDYEPPTETTNVEGSEANEAHDESLS